MIYADTEAYLIPKSNFDTFESSNNDTSDNEDDLNLDALKDHFNFSTNDLDPDYTR